MFRHLVTRTLPNPALVRFFSQTSSPTLQPYSSLLKGLELRIVAQLPEAMDVTPFVQGFFKAPILASTEQSELGGEHILTTLHQNSEHESSFHIMHFEGRQDKHFHPGPRCLIYSVASRGYFTPVGSCRRIGRHARRFLCSKHYSRAIALCNFGFRHFSSMDLKERISGRSHYIIPTRPKLTR
jgi:hypothetical protein